MSVLADENIPYVRDAAADLGPVRTLAGRAMTRAALREAGATCLFVRSVTRVDRALLAGTDVRFVGTATIGTDHVDREYLAAAGIGFASAPGSNATSVAEYVAAALLTLAERRGRALAGRTLGIVGVGNVGSRVAAKARALGLRVLRNDPPRARREGGDGFTELPVLLAESDIVTCHVPLERGGPDPTVHLAGEDFFARLRPGAIFLNTSRGAVCDEAALHRALDGGRLGGAVLDVWEEEPALDPRLLERVDLATPHIAGYSFDGKVRGTEMIVNAAREHFGLDGAWRAGALLPPPAVPVCELDPAGRSCQSLLHEAVSAVYDITADDAALRAGLAEPATLPARFDRLRKEYPRRREFPNTTVRLRGPAPEAAAALAGLGFALGDADGES
jgi:erythronate-4-phosphate dehydrogenase